jgi:hypothetical protein
LMPIFSLYRFLQLHNRHIMHLYNVYIIIARHVVVQSVIVNRYIHARIIPAKFLQCKMKKEDVEMRCKSNITNYIYCTV